jgi:hypothetical protein
VRRVHGRDWATYLQTQILMRLSQPADTSFFMTFKFPPFAWIRLPGIAAGAQVTALHPIPWASITKVSQEPSSSHRKKKKRACMNKKKKKQGHLLMRVCLYLGIPIQTPFRLKKHRPTRLLVHEVPRRQSSLCTRQKSKTSLAWPVVSPVTWCCMNGMFFDLCPDVVLFLPDEYTAIIGARRQDVAKLGMGPRHLPHWSIVSISSLFPKTIQSATS